MWRVTNESNLFGYCYFFHQESKRRWLKPLQFLWLRSSGAPEERAVFRTDVFGSQQASLFDELGVRTGSGIISEYKPEPRCLDPHANGRFKCL